LIDNMERLLGRSESGRDASFWWRFYFIGAQRGVGVAISVGRDGVTPPSPAMPRTTSAVGRASESARRADLPSPQQADGNRYAVRQIARRFHRLRVRRPTARFLPSRISAAIWSESRVLPRLPMPVSVSTRVSDERGPRLRHLAVAGHEPRGLLRRIVRCACRVSAARENHGAAANARSARQARARRGP